MATLALTILAAKPTKAGKYPIFIRIAVRNDKEYIKTEYQLDDASQWYDGKVVARNDATMMNKRILFELKKYKDRLQYIDSYDCYTISTIVAPHANSGSRTLGTQGNKVPVYAVKFSILPQTIFSFPNKGVHSPKRSTTADKKLNAIAIRANREK